jgi:hypothetical protein
VFLNYIRCSAPIRIHNQTPSPLAHNPRLHLSVRHPFLKMIISRLGGSLMSAAACLGMASAREQDSPTALDWVGPVSRSHRLWWLLC